MKLYNHPEDKKTQILSAVLFHFFWSCKMFPVVLAISLFFDLILGRVKEKLG